MNPADRGWLDVARVVTEALDVPIEARAAYLAAHCPDPSQRAAAERLLRACEQGATSPVLDAPAVQFAAPILAEVQEHERAVPEPLRAALAERYSIERELGRGGQATVYLARDERHGRLVALKVLHPPAISDDESPAAGATGAARFQREIELAARLSHPHILPLYDSGAAAGRLYYVTPYVDGESLRDRIARTGRLSLPETVRVLRDVARALAHAHRHGVVHRDIKPGNILLNQEGDALVSDFGVAKALAEAATPVDAFLGTPAYMAPEQAGGGPDIDHRADLYSFGIVAYVLLTGATPFGGRTRHELLAAHRSEVPEPVATRQPEVPPALAALVDRLLAKRPSDRPRDAAEVLELLDTVVTTSGQSDRGRQRGSRRFALVGGGLVVATVLAIGAALIARRMSPPPVLAVGELVGRVETDSLNLAAIVGDMLALNLARVPGLPVVSRVRQFELMRQLGGASVVDAARHAGAMSLLDGEVQAQNGGLRLVVRRVNLSTGSIEQTHTIDGGDAFELADRATAELAKGLGLSVVPLRVVDVSTSSLHAYRAYEEGLRSFGTGDYGRALERFESALTGDSMFAMAAFYAWQSGRLGNRSTAAITLGRLDSLAARAADRERLLIRGAVAYVSNDPRGAAFGDSLAIQFPVELDGLLLQAQARAAGGDLLGAIPLFRRVIAIDSLALRGMGAAPTTHHRCLACTAYVEIANCYLLADSAVAAERVARELMRRQPGSPEGWRWLGQALALQDRHEEAAAALRAAAAASRPDIPAVAFFPMIFAIVAGDFHLADSALADVARHGTAETQQDALWYRIISLRTQGRLREALVAAERLERLGNSGGVIQRAQVLFELGRFRDAAHVFDSLAAFLPPALVGGALARNKTWRLTLLATTRAAAGDTAALEALLEPIRAWGARSAYGRDTRLHYHARGLLLAARGRLEDAAAEFRRAIYSPTHGYTRTNYELGRVLLALGRPSEAAQVVEPALRGPIDASNLYITRTELHALLGDALEAAGALDQAAVHFRRVLVAWSHADPELHARREAISSRLSRLANAPAQ